MLVKLIGFINDHTQKRSASALSLEISALDRKKLLRDAGRVSFDLHEGLRSFEHD